MQDACYMKMRSAPFAGRVSWKGLSHEIYKLWIFLSLNFSPKPIHIAEDIAESRLSGVGDRATLSST